MSDSTKWEYSNYKDNIAKSITIEDGPNKTVSLLSKKTAYTSGILEDEIVLFHLEPDIAEAIGLSLISTAKNVRKQNKDG